MNFRGRVIALTLTLGICASGIIAVFWYQEMRYQLPTPVPVNHEPIAVGANIFLPRAFAKNSAYFLHFYNPDCPCSRFNVRHLRSLISQYKDSVTIVVVVSDENAFNSARSEFGKDVRRYVDSDGSLARACGVYSTPQAAIIDTNHNLYYRGNYNASRYCTARATNFAELSLIGLLNKQPPPMYGLIATQSYGCELQNTTTPVSFF